MENIIGIGNITGSGVVTLIKYTVAFDTDGGSSVEDQYIERNGLVIRPPEDPIKVGYALDDWYKDEDRTILWDFDTEPVTGNTTIYAKWTIKQYTATSPQDIEDFGEGADIYDIFNVSDEQDWNNVRHGINTSGNDRNYIINVTDDFSLAGITSSTFTSTGINISIRGNASVINNTASTDYGSTQAGGIYITGQSYTDGSGNVTLGTIFRIEGGTISGNNAVTGSQLYLSTQSGFIPIPQRGYFTGDTWTSLGNLGTTNSAITVEMGVLQ